jgi:signal transduction histidine kinase
MDDSIETLRQRIAELDLEKRQLMRLEESNLTEEQHDYLDKMHLVVADGLGLIRNLTDYRNLEYRKTEVLLEKVNLGQVILLAIRNFQSVASKKKITLQHDIPKTRTLKSDHHCVIRILENLVSNAIKFSQEGSTVTITVGEEEGKPFFSIQDEGPGFTAEDQKKLYEKFAKLSAQPTAGESTTGLGLFIVKEMAAKIGATVQCETEQGKGSKFTVTFERGD